MTSIEQENRYVSNFEVTLPSDFDSFYEKVRDESNNQNNYLVLSSTPIEDDFVSTEHTLINFYEKCFISTLKLSETAKSKQNNGFFSQNTIEEIKKSLASPSSSLKISKAEYENEGGKVYSSLRDIDDSDSVVRKLRFVSKECGYTLEIDFNTRNFIKEEHKIRKQHESIPPPQRDPKLSNREYREQLDRYQKGTNEKEEQLAKSIATLKSEKNQQIEISVTYDVLDGYESCRKSCSSYAFIYKNVVFALYGKSGAKYPTKSISFQYPPPEIKREDVKIEEKPQEIIEKNVPEISPTNIIINLPDMSTFYEFTRDNFDRIVKTRGKQERMVISKTEIRDKIFENEITDLLIGNQGFALLTTLNFSKEKLLHNLGYYDGNTQNILIKLFEQKRDRLESMGTKLDSLYYDEDNDEGNYSFSIYKKEKLFNVSFGCLNTENNNIKLTKIWQNKNPAPRQGNLSDREFQEKLQEYSNQLSEYSESVTNLENKSITITTNFNTAPEDQQSFIVLFEMYSELQRMVMETIYEVEGIQGPNVAINYTIPKLEGEETITSDTKLQENESVKATNELREIRAVNKRKWAEWDGFDSIGGQEKAVAEAKKLVYAIKNPEVYEKRGVKQPKGILLYGPPGTGKTMLAKAVAKEAEAEFFNVSISDIGSKWHGESERMMQEVFDNANSAARNNRKAIIYFDEIDSIAPNRDEAYEVSRKILSVILQNMDGMRSNKNVTVIAATNRVQDIDPAIKRSGRFDKLIEMGPPDKDGRISILKKQIDKVAKSSSEPENMFDKDLDLEKIGSLTNGMNGADIANLINQMLEEKLIKELKGTPWSPTTTQEILDMIPKIGRIAKEQKHLGFILSK